MVKNILTWTRLSAQLLVEIAGAATLVVGIGLVYVPAALIAAGVIAILAIERT